jgi:hypothetical protein
VSDKIKRAARQRMAETGEPYTLARRKAIEEHAAAQPEPAAWTDNEDGPDCACGNPTVVKILPSGRAILLCLFHTAESGSYTELPAERPADWGNASGQAMELGR